MFRVVLDYYLFNKNIQYDKYPLSFIDDLLNRLA